MKKAFEINIMGQKLSVMSDSGDEHVASVVQYVKDRAEEIKASSGSVNTTNIAILTALNIADEYFRLKGVNSEVCSQLDNRAEKLINMINDVK